MLSILIPCYNFNAVPLVKELHKQASKLKIAFEIICIDDASKSGFNTQNKTINQLQNTHFHELDSNIGRSAIRNYLATQAKYSNLLFLDVDVLPKNTNFIKSFIELKTQQVIYGGIECSITQVKKENALRLKYTLSRECIPLHNRLLKPYNSFSSACFYIQKSVFNTVKFDESLKNYGWEDVLFAYQLQQLNIPITHINNPVFHDNIETSAVYLQKTVQALENLNYLISKEKLPYSFYKITRFHQFLKKYHLTFFLQMLFTILQKSIEKNLLSKNPKLYLFDFYRVGILNHLTQK